MKPIAYKTTEFVLCSLSTARHGGLPLRVAKFASETPLAKPNSFFTPATIFNAICSNPNLHPHSVLPNCSIPLCINKTVTLKEAVPVLCLNSYHVQCFSKFMGHFQNVSHNLCFLRPRQTCTTSKHMNHYCPICPPN